MGTGSVSTTRKDRWGTLHPGCIRNCRISMRYGDLEVPLSWFGTKQEIYIEPENQTNSQSD